MHGILFKELKTHVSEEWGEDAWEEALDRAEIEPKLYLPVTEYPDEEAIRLIEGVAEVTGTDEPELLSAFGEALAPALLDTFKAHIQSDWDTMDLLEHSGNAVFTVFYSEAGDPTEVTTTREDADTVVIEYGSPLEMCDLAMGVVRGMATERGESVEVAEGACMHQGSGRCEITVTRG